GRRSRSHKNPASSPRFCTATSMSLLLGRRPPLSLPDARLRQFQSSSWASPTRSGLDSRRVLHTPAATPRAAATSRPILALSWWEGVVVNFANPGAVAQMDGTQRAVHALGLQSQVVNAGTLEEYERAFARLKIEGVNGVLLLQDPSNTGNPATGKNCRACAAAPVANRISATGERGGGRSHVVWSQH